MDAIIFLVIGLLTGMLSGLFGVGGGFILVPLLVFAKVPVHEAVGTSLAYIAITSMYGSWKHYKNKNINLKLATLLIVVASIVVVSAGVRLNEALSPEHLKIAFAVLLLLVSGYFFYKKKLKGMMNKTQSDEEHVINEHWFANATLGAVIGLLSGVFGVGGGFLLVPALVLIIHMPIKLAIGTSLFVIIFSSIVGAVSHALLGNITYIALPWLILGGFVGVNAGTTILHRAHANKIESAFIAVLLIAAFYMGYSAIG